MRLTREVYEHTAGFPKSELYGLTQQIRRAAVSVPSNIAEGKGYRSDKDFVRFLRHARGSLLELQTQLLIAGDLAYASREKSQAVLNRAEAVGRALSGLINSMTGIAA
jgi:four helix bundle protein